MEINTTAYWLMVLSEFLGTMVLIILGNGVNYSVSARRMFANQSGKWIVIIFGWGIAVFCGVIVSLALGGEAHLNPAVTLFKTISSKNPAYLIWIIFQIFGAMFGQIVLNFINWKHIQETELAIIRSAHCTGPAFNNKEKSTIFNFSYELVGTLMLVGVILAFGKGLNNLGSLGPLPVTLLVVGIGASLGASTGYAINPARDFGPRVVYTLMEKFLLKSRKSEHITGNWSYSWVPVLAPSTAGIIIGLFGLI
ncbi:glycerol uptake facilitator protein [Mycoplasmopsis mustelae]|uniref:Glycerol uptake facilitator protein n=1 Tax=Mycoplasmopsis mustelae TaxID=171289 RepID=A0A4V3FNY5_9BACT|nr:MIP/aquaporin family protein [Mycoplasmopsis mustelae]TDV24390.1 glycerol uptake facilitator protein [Mycoplasmopsis mustelae]